MRKFIEEHQKLIAYLFFGALTTLVNIVVYAAGTALGLSVGWANALAWVLSVVFAYYTNRRWVFQSACTGLWERLRELGAFAACRLGTGLMDQVIMILGVDYAGSRFIAPDHRYIWGLGVKVASNVLVIVLNYVLSKVFVFKKQNSRG